MKHGNVLKKGVILKDKQGENIPAEKIIFAAVVFVIALYHIVLPISFGDDMVYKILLDEQTLMEFLRFQWEHWTSRILIEFVLLSVIKYDFLWRILDTVFVVALGTSLGRITEEKAFSYVILLLYPFHDMASAGWVNTTLNYLWPMCCGLLICVNYKKYISGDKLSPWTYLWSIPVMLFACDQEQMVVVMLILTCGLIAVCISQKQYKIPYVYLMLFLNLLCLVKMILCPGNQARSVTETDIRYASFSGLSAGDKLFLGIYNVESNFIARPHILFFPITLLFAFLVFRKTMSGWKRMIAVVPAGLSLAHCILAESMTKWTKVFWRFEGGKFELESIGIYRWLVLLYFGLVLSSLVFTMYILFEDDMRRFWMMLIIWGAGLASAVMMGFSPTMFDSGARTMIFFCFVMMGVSGICVHKYKKCFTDLPQDVQIFLYCTGAVWISASVINELAFIVGYIKNT